MSINKEILTIDKFKEALDSNEDNLVIIIIYLQNLIKNSNDSNTILQAKAAIFKKIKRTDTFWYTDYLSDFFEKRNFEKKSEITNQKNEINNKGLNSIIKYLFAFFTENPNFCPLNFDMREVLKKC